MCRRKPATIPHKRERLLVDPWSLDDDTDWRPLALACLGAFLAMLLCLGIIKVHEKHKALAAAGEIECYAGVGNNC